MKKLFYLFLLTAVYSFGQAIPVDTQFNNGQNAFQSPVDVHKIVAQPDGKLIVSGYFINYNNVEAKTIVRVNPDGTLDESFNSGQGISGGEVSTIIIGSDNKIYIAGSFTSYNGVPRKNIARLNPDGSLDLTFNPGIGLSNDSVIYCMQFTLDGKLLIGGSFTFFSAPETYISALVCLNLDGTLNTSFSHIYFESYEDVKAMDMQSDGKILIGGFFATTLSLKRLYPNGGVESGFAQNNGFFGGVNFIKVSPNDEIYLGGMFVGLDVPRRFFFRLLPDGSLDSDFNVNTEGVINNSIYNNVQSLAFWPNGIIIGGEIPTYFGEAAGDLLFLNNDGTINNNFSVGTGFEYTAMTLNSYVSSICVQSGDKIVVGGKFSLYNGQIVNSFTRLIGTPLSIENNYINDGLGVYSSESYLNIVSKTQNIINVELYDLMGRVMFSSAITGSNIQVPIARSGQCLVGRVQISDGEVKAIKVLH